MINSAYLSSFDWSEFEEEVLSLPRGKSAEGVPDLKWTVRIQERGTQLYGKGKDDVISQLLDSTGVLVRNPEYNT